MDALTIIVPTDELRRLVKKLAENPAVPRQTIMELHGNIALQESINHCREEDDKKKPPRVDPPFEELAELPFHSFAAMHGEGSLKFFSTKDDDSYLIHASNSETSVTLRLTRLQLKHVHVAIRNELEEHTIRQGMKEKT